MTAFGPAEVDALQEIATIGCGRAITALGKLTGRRIEMDVPEAWVGAAPGAIAQFLGALGEDLVAVGVNLEGPLTGDLLLALPERDAERLAAMLGFPPAPGGAGWTGMAESALMESGNIVGSAFVSAVAAFVRAVMRSPLPESFAKLTGPRFFLCHRFHQVHHHAPGCVIAPPGTVNHRRPSSNQATEYFVGHSQDTAPRCIRPCLLNVLMKGACHTHQAGFVERVLIPSIFGRTIPVMGE